MRHLDLRPFERIVSVMLWPTLVGLALLPGFLALIFALLAERPLVPLVLAGCVGLTGLPFALALVLVLRWSRTGAARGFLDELAKSTGGTASCATLLFPLLSPRLEGELEGRAFRLDLRRTAGVMSPSTVGRKFAIWGWMLKVNVATRAKGPTLGFGPPGAQLASLLGLGGGVDKEGVRVFTADTEVGRALAEDPEVIAEVTGILAVVGPLFVLLDPGGAGLTGQLPGEITPAQAATVLRTLAALAARYDAALSG